MTGPRVCVPIACLLLSSGAKAAPSWFPSGDDPAYPDKTFVVGVAACGKDTEASKRAACAAQRATEQIAFLLSSHVEATRKRKTQSETKTNGGDRLHTSTTTVEQDGRMTTSLELEAIQPVHAECNAPEQTCYTFVALNRNATAQRWMSRHNVLKSQLSDALDSIERLDPLGQLRTIFQARTLVKQQDELAALIAAIASDIEPPEPVLPRFEVLASKRLATISVCLVASGATESPQIYSQLRDRLDALKLQKVDLGGLKSCGDTALMVIAVTAFEPERRLFGTMIVADIRARIELYTNGRQVAVSPPMLGHGVAKTSDSAREAAIDQLSSTVSTYVMGLLTENK